MSDPAKVGGLFDGFISGVIGSTAAGQKLPSLLADLDGVISSAGATAAKAQALSVTLAAAAAQFEEMANEAKIMTTCAARLSADLKAIAAAYGVKP